MEIGLDGKPTRAKMSSLVVRSDRSHGILGKADLDLSLYGTSDF